MCWSLAWLELTFSDTKKEEFCTWEVQFILSRLTLLTVKHLRANGQLFLQHRSPIIAMVASVLLRSISCYAWNTPGKADGTASTPVLFPFQLTLDQPSQLVSGCCPVCLGAVAGTLPRDFLYAAFQKGWEGSNTKLLLACLSMVVVSKQLTFPRWRVKVCAPACFQWYGIVKALRGQSRAASGKGKLCH